MDINLALAALSLVASLFYGLVLVGRPPSLLRMVVKTTAVAALAVLAWQEHRSPLLIGALALSALGDAFMADPKRFLPAGMASFLLAHVAYIALFLSYLRPELIGQEPWRGLAMVATVVVAVGLFVWLRPSLGKLKAAVAAYVLAIGTMVIEALMLHPYLWPATLGAVLFMASDAILAAQLFREAKLGGSQRLTHWSVWFLYPPPLRSLAKRPPRAVGWQQDGGVSGGADKSPQSPARPDCTVILNTPKLLHRGVRHARFVDRHCPARYACCGAAAGVRTPRVAQKAIGR